MAYNVGFIGLGRMGWHMAGHIHKTAGPVGVWNRTRKRAEEHAAEFGTVVVEKIEDFRCPVVFCCLPTSVEVAAMSPKLVEARRRADAGRHNTCGRRS